MFTKIFGYQLPKMFTKTFGKPKQESVVASPDELDAILEMLREMEKSLTEMASTEVESAKEYMREKNKMAVIQCLKKKKVYRQQIEQLENLHFCIFEKLMHVLLAQTAIATINVLRTGATAKKAMRKRIQKAMPKGTNINGVDMTMNEINELARTMKQILSDPIGAAADFDEDELEAEFEELKGAEVEEQLLQPATIAPAAPVHVAVLLPDNKLGLLVRSKQLRKVNLVHC